MVLTNVPGRVRYDYKIACKIVYVYTYMYTYMYIVSLPLSRSQRSGRAASAGEASLCSCFGLSDGLRNGRTVKDSQCGYLA